MLSNKKIIRAFNKKACKWTDLFLLAFLIILLLPSCKLRERNKEEAKILSIVNENFKNYKIPENIYKDEWKVESYRLFDPNFFESSVKKKTKSPDIFRYQCKKWFRGKQVSGKVVKFRLILYANVKTNKDGTRKISEVNVGNISPLNFGIQLYTWFFLILLALMISVGFLQFKNWLGWLLSFVYSAFAFGVISYNCFMSGWGVVIGYLIIAIASSLIYAIINSK